MAIYDLKCMECGERVEIFSPITQEPPKRDCQCGGKMELVFHPYVIFMGKAPQSFHTKFAYPHYDAKKP